MKGLVNLFEQRGQGCLAGRDETTVDEDEEDSICMLDTAVSLTSSSRSGAAPHTIAGSDSFSGDREGDLDPSSTILAEGTVSMADLCSS